MELSSFHFLRIGAATSFPVCHAVGIWERIQSFSGRRFSTRASSGRGGRPFCLDKSEWARCYSLCLGSPQGSETASESNPDQRSSITSSTGRQTSGETGCEGDRAHPQLLNTFDNFLKASSSIAMLSLPNSLTSSELLKMTNPLKYPLKGSPMPSPLTKNLELGA